MIVKCNNCGKELPSDSQFCQYCGSKNISIIKNTERNIVTIDNKKYKKPFYITLVIAVCLLLSSLYLLNLYSNANKNATYYLENNNTLTKRLNSVEQDLTKYKTNAYKYNYIASYSNNTKGYSNFYAKTTLIRNPKNEIVWIYCGDGQIECQPSSSAVTAKWGDWSGYWIPLTITYNGSGVECVKVTDTASLKHFYIIIIGG